MTMRFSTAFVSVSIVLSAALTPASAAEMKAVDFANTAAGSDAFEIQSSQLALQKSRNDKVKAFAEEMIKQHSQSTAKLKAAAQEAHIQVDATLPKELQSKLDALKTASGPTFDAAYLSAQISVHTKAAQLFGNFSKDGEGGPIKAFAQQTYPVIRTHLVRVQALTTKQ
jgi:predicted outer membrane protein